jgi:hypothetical protein
MLRKSCASVVRFVWRSVDEENAAFRHAPDIHTIHAPAGWHVDANSRMNPRFRAIFLVSSADSTTTIFIHSSKRVTVTGLLMPATTARLRRKTCDGIQH